MWKTYFLRTEEPLGCPLGPSWNSAAAPSWAPALDGPVLAEHCLRPVWLSAFARMCGGTSEADDALWAEVDELRAQQGEEASEATATRLIEGCGVLSVERDNVIRFLQNWPPIT